VLIRILGGGLILFVTTMFGFFRAGQLARREKNLCRFETALSVLENEISYSSARLCEAFSRVSKISGLTIFQSAGEEIGTRSFSEIWSSTLTDFQSELCLSDADVEALNLLSEQLGKSDRTHQLQCIRHTATLLRQNHADAVAQNAQSGKLYRSLGLLSGIFLVMLLL